MNNIDQTTLASISLKRRARPLSNYRPSHRQEFLGSTANSLAKSTAQPDKGHWLTSEKFVFSQSVASRHSFAELDKVRLVGQITYDNEIVPDGSEGTIVYRYSGGKAYEVEFEALEPIVVTLRYGDIERA